MVFIRGNEVNQESIHEFVQGLDLLEEAKANLLNLTRHTNIRAAIKTTKIVDVAVIMVNRFRHELQSSRSKMFYNNFIMSNERYQRWSNTK